MSMFADSLSHKARTSKSMWRPPLFQSNLLRRHSFMLFGLLMCLAVWLFLWFTLTQDKQNALIEIENRSREIAIAAKAHADRLFSAPTLALSLMADEMDNFQGTLSEMDASSGPYKKIDFLGHSNNAYQSILIIDRDGVLRLSGPIARVRHTNSRQMPLSLKDRKYFTILSQMTASHPAANRLYVSDRLLNRVDDLPSVILARAFYAKNGAFRGVSAIAMTTQHIENQFQGIGQKNFSIFLWNPEHNLIASSEDINPENQKDLKHYIQTYYDGCKPFCVIPKEDSVLIFSGSSDQNYGIAVRANLDNLLKNWKESRNDHIYFGISFTIFILLSAFLINIQKKRLAKAEYIANDFKVFHSFFSEVGIGLVILDENNLISAANPAFEALIHDPETDFRGFPIEHFLEGFIPPSPHAPANQDPLFNNQDVTLRCSDGQTRTVRCTIRPLTGLNLAPAITILSVEDITELRQTQRNLIHRVRFQETLLDALPFLITVKDLNGQFLHVNKAFLDFTQQRKDHVLGRTSRDILQDKIWRTIEPSDKKLVENGGTDELEIDITTKEGRHKTVQFIRTLIPHFEVQSQDLSNKNPSTKQDSGLILSIALDITALKDSTRALAAQSKELTRSNQELAQFAYVASHDLREPLRMITGFLDLLRRHLGTKLDETSEEFLTYALDGARRMDLLVKDLLEVSRAGRKTEATSPIGLMKGLEPTLAVLQMPLVDIGAAIKYPETLPNVLATEVDLQRLFQNLLSNAIRYRDPDRPLIIAIACEADPQSDGFIVSVTDNGIGVPPDATERIFGIFQRLQAHKPGTEEQSTGIGLAVCRKVVESFGGKLWVEPVSDGPGSRFCFLVPQLKSTDIKKDIQLEKHPLLAR